MNRSSLLSFSFFAMAMVGVALPAQASRWEQAGDPAFWIDLDSVTTKEGLTYFATVHLPAAEVPTQGRPDLSGVTPELNAAFNCATEEFLGRSIVNHEAYFQDRTHTVKAQYEWLAVVINAEQRAAIKRLVCGS
jgi:hypothetical protein